MTQHSPTPGLGDVWGVSSSCASLSGVFVATLKSDMPMGSEVSVRGELVGCLGGLQALLVLLDGAGKICRRGIAGRGQRRSRGSKKKSIRENACCEMFRLRGRRGRCFTAQPGIGCERIDDDADTTSICYLFFCQVSVGLGCTLYLLSTAVPQRHQTERQERPQS